MRARIPGRPGAVVVALCMVCWPEWPAAQDSGEPSLPGEWVSQRPPTEVFTAARDTLLALGFRLEREEARTGILMTRRRGYDAGWPDGPALGLAATQTPDAARLYLRVASDFHPARLVVGAVVETETVFVPFKLPIARGRQTFYRQERFADFVAGRIAERLGERLDPLSPEPGVRTHQSRPTGTAAAACAALPRLAGGVVDAPPKPLLDVKPQYLSTELRRLQGGTVRLRAEVTEHGTVTGARWVGGVEERNLVAAAVGAAGLWQFEPALKQGCPVRTFVVFEISFSQAP